MLSCFLFSMKILDQKSPNALSWSLILLVADNIGYICFQALESQGAHSSKVGSNRKSIEVRPASLDPSLASGSLVLNRMNSSDRGDPEGSV